MHKISIIIPVYNCEKYISDCLKSIVNQKYENKEIIIVNDCSTDSTKKICEKFTNTYNYIKLINLENNMGVSNARNIGLKNATGDYIHFIDSDDAIKENLYKSLEENVLQNYEYHLIIFGADYIYKDKVDSDFSNIEKKCTNSEEISNYLYNVNIKQKPRVLNVIWNKLYSKKIIEKNSLKFDTNINLGEDFVFNCNYFKCIESLNEISNIYYNYYIRNENSLTTKFRTDVISRRTLIYKEWINLYKFYNIYDEKKEKEFEEFEGFLMYCSLYSIFQINATLSEEEKLNFIKEMITSNHIKTVLNYLDGKGLYRLEKNILQKKNVKKIYIYMKIKHTLKEMIKKIIKFFRKEKII